MSKITAYTALLAQQLSDGGVPDLVFTDNNHMRDSIRALGAATPTEDSIEVYQVPQVVDIFNRLSADKLNNGHIFAPFRSVTAAFATKLSAGVEDLRTIKKEVGTLADTVNDRLTSKMLRDPTLTEAFSLAGDVAMDMIDWSGMNHVNEQSVIAKMHDSINYGITDSITDSTIIILLDKIPYATAANQIPLSQVRLPAAKFNEVVAQLHKRMLDKPRTVIADALQNILCLDAPACLAAINNLRALSRGQQHVSITRHLELIDIYSRILPLIDNRLVDVSAATYTELVKHIGIVQQITDMSVYLCSYYRSTLWKDAVLVAGPLINPDNYNAYTDNGGSTTKLYQLYTEMFTDSSIPRKGVTVGFAIKTSNELTAKIQKRASVDKAEANNKRAAMLRNEFIYTATEWLNAHRAELSPKFVHHDLSKYAEIVYDTQPDAPLTSKLYSLILNSCHLHGMAPMLYNRLSTAYTKQAGSVESFTKENCDSIEAMVYADMIAEYLVNHGIIQM